MSMCHKAFAFDWKRFEAELLPLVKGALCSGDPKELRAWCREHQAAMTDPYEGEPLATNWEQVLEKEDVDEYSDYALTSFYDPVADFGLNDAWLDVQELLDKDARVALLGDAVADSGRAFDPGRLGSFFQAPAQVALSVTCLRAVDNAMVQEFANSLHTNCVANGLGLYVTF